MKSWCCACCCICVRMHRWCCGLSRYVAALLVYTILSQPVAAVLRLFHMQMRSHPMQMRSHPMTITWSMLFVDFYASHTAMHQHPMTTVYCMVSRTGHTLLWLIASGLFHIHLWSQHSTVHCIVQYNSVICFAGRSMFWRRRSRSTRSLPDCEQFEYRAGPSTALV